MIWLDSCRVLVITSLYLIAMQKRKLRSFKEPENEKIAVEELNLAEPGEPEKKKPKVDTPENVPSVSDKQYWFWPDDGRSYTKEFITEFVSTLNEENKKTPHGTPVEYYWRLERSVKNFGDSEYCEFFLDKSRNARDKQCSLSFEPFATCEPYVLNLNGRSYAKAAIMEAIEVLSEGHPLRLEDVTIEPEQLVYIKLYPNYTLGAPETSTVVGYEEVEVPIKAFDIKQTLEENPAFWDAVAVVDSNGIWSMESAAVKFGFTSGRCKEPLVKNQLCTNRKVPWPHPKMNGSGAVILRNCLFRNCEIDIDCWCGPRFHGCRFEDCVFLFDPQSYCEERAKRCEIVGGRVKAASKNPRYTQDYMRQWLRKYLGQEGCTLDV